MDKDYIISIMALRIRIDHVLSMSMSSFHCCGSSHVIPSSDHRRALWRLLRHEHNEVNEFVCSGVSGSEDPTVLQGIAEQMSQN